MTPADLRQTPQAVEEPRSSLHALLELPSCIYAPSRAEEPENLAKIALSSETWASYPLPDYIWFCLCVSLCIMGCVLMIAADAQKYFTLRIKRGLITDGMYRFIRHPDY